MKTVSIKRLLAFCVDYLILSVYGLLLFIIVWHTGLASFIDTPWMAQLVGFTCLTLPVFLYFVLFESSARKATLGKSIFHLIVKSDTTGAIIKRNILKFLPWEIAHTGIHWLFYYNRLGQEPPYWVFVLLICPQIMACFYVLKIFQTKGNKSWYDIWAETKVTTIQ